MDFEFKHLVAFCTVVDEENFSKAAEHLGVAQASISERIATLEFLVGTRLLDRMGRRTIPTEAGRVFEKKARELVSLRKLLVQDMQDHLGMRKGTIRIGASTVPGEYILPRIMARLRSDFPQICGELFVASTGDVLDMVREGRIEAGYVGAEVASPDLLFEQAWSDEIVLTLAPDHRWANRKSVALMELVQEPLIARFPGSGTQQVADQHLGPLLLESQSQLNVVATMSTSSAVKQAIQEGLGSAFLSLRAIEFETRTGHLSFVRLDEITIQRHFYLVRSSRRQASKLFETLLEYTREP
jgi:DNA-binding transcriptional LysR family regulator